MLSSMEHGGIGQQGVMMRKLTILGILATLSIIFLATAVYTSALTVVSLGSGKYDVTFSSGTKAIASNIQYDQKTYQMTIDINVTNGKGLKMVDIIEAKDYGQTLNGRAKRYDKNIIEIN